jgi:hypothetical protein
VRPCAQALCALLLLRVREILEREQALYALLSLTTGEEGRETQSARAQALCALLLLRIIFRRPPPQRPPLSPAALAELQLPPAASWAGGPALGLGGGAGRAPRPDWQAEQLVGNTTGPGKGGGGGGGGHGVGSGAGNGHGVGNGGGKGAGGGVGGGRPPPPACADLPPGGPPGRRCCGDGLCTGPERPFNCPADCPGP